MIEILALEHHARTLNAMAATACSNVMRRMGVVRKISKTCWATCHDVNRRSSARRCHIVVVSGSSSSNRILTWAQMSSTYRWNCFETQAEDVPILARYVLSRVEIESQTLLDVSKMRTWRVQPIHRHDRLTCPSQDDSETHKMQTPQKRYTGHIFPASRVEENSKHASWTWVRSDDIPSWVLRTPLRLRHSTLRRTKHTYRCNMCVCHVSKWREWKIEQMTQSLLPDFEKKGSNHAQHRESAQGPRSETRDCCHFSCSIKRKSLGITTYYI